jgi:protease-4
MKKDNRFLKALVILAFLILLSLALGRLIKSIPARNTIAVIPIEGAILSDFSSSPFSEKTASAKEILDFLDKANQDKSVKGIILEINSPGGSALASKEVVDKVKSIEKPIVSWIREVGASGAYWIASASDSIIADELSITGSIGVISSYLEFSGLMDEYGVKYEQLTTGRYKDIQSPYKELTLEEKDILMQKLKIIHKTFADDVSKNRKRDITGLDTGLFYLGKEALDLGLIDSLGGKDLAINITKQLANITEAELVIYERKVGLSALLEKFGASAFYSFGSGFSSALLNKNQGINLN